MNRIRHLLRHFSLFLINHFFSGNHFWGIKRSLMKTAGARVGENSKIVGPIYFTCDLTIGENCWIGLNFSAHGNGKVTIGDRCDVAPDVIFLTGSHEMGTHERRAGRGIALPIVIGNGCWIGARSTILGNVVIGDGCMIASNATVTQSFDNDLLIAGVPATCKRELD